MNATARALVMQRLNLANDLKGLRRVWDSLGWDYKRDPEVVALKDNLKERLTDG